MKYFVSSLVAISNAMRHHDDTFYSEYVVNGHIHEDDNEVYVPPSIYVNNSPNGGNGVENNSSLHNSDK